MSSSTSGPSSSYNSSSSSWNSSSSFMSSSSSIPYSSSSSSAFFSSSNSSNSDLTSSTSSEPSVTIEGPNRIGITTGNHDRDQTGSAEFKSAPGDAQTATITATEGAERIEITITGRDPENGIVNFTIRGVKKSQSSTDVTIEAVGPSGSATLNLSVVVPDHIKKPYPNFIGVVVPTCTAAGPDSVPPAKGIPKNQRIYGIRWGTALTITVLDQFGDEIGGLYNGSDITEQQSKLNVKLQADSTYSDAVSITEPKYVYQFPPTELLADFLSPM